jgi:hypothetical protein
MSAKFFARRRILASTTAASRFIDRVTADGGTVVNAAEIMEAYSFAATYALNPVLTHWSSARFAYKLNQAGRVVRLYCLFGNDAVAREAIGWALLPAAGGKFANIEVSTGSFNDVLVVPAMPWASQALTASVVSLAYAYNYTNGTYAFTPMLESTNNWNNNSGFLLCVENAYHGIEAGFSGGSGGYNFRGASSPPTYEQTAYTLVVDPAATDYRLAAIGKHNGIPQLNEIGYNALASNVFANQPAYIGSRGDSPQYYWMGTINEVFFTGAVLPDAAVTYLDSQRAKY